MIYLAAADLIVLIHFGFVVFSAFGGFLALRWNKLIWIHLPAAFWAISIEFTGWICPLTPLEIWFRHKSGAAAYQSGFIEHYILSFLYPASLTRTIQIFLGILLLFLNICVYGWMLRTRLKH